MICLAPLHCSTLVYHRWILQYSSNWYGPYITIQHSVFFKSRSSSLRSSESEVVLAYGSNLTFDLESCRVVAESRPQMFSSDGLGQI